MNGEIGGLGDVMFLEDFAVFVADGVFDLGEEVFGREFVRVRGGEEDA